ncbi:MAG: PIG-L family deacetylase [candidate division KSB1 bacterium]|nr:PIG-L family deacetylase [candidate division KSB1 bacterium]MDZ7272569.1 PIG-L family deacetylase [candidate division KSB1 bacterium]MDZ7284408.1 PIG-L family deacetylase [candidate division KSB1 bacterium]MDZ7297196.1 PIG-L family deacetylase [candidate division KSB1 bacterium]MDZ7308095.1 PIG-L family deacetylase [candidate division KSB1 bacterium]
MIRLRTVVRSLPALFAVLGVACERTPPSPPYFPETGRPALYQRSLDARTDLRVLSLALQPGSEDLATLAYFRLGRGASIMSAFASNGEAGESDVRSEYPAYLAAGRRAEATRAAAHLGAEVYFLNLPDLAAARDSASVRRVWPADSVRAKLARLFLKFQPDVVLLAFEPERGAAGMCWPRRCLAADVLATVQQLKTGIPALPVNGAGTPQRWSVNRVFMEDSSGLVMPVQEVHPLWKKSYEAIAAEAAQAYASLNRQRQVWRSSRPSAYALLMGAAGRDPAALDAGLPLPASSRLRSLDRRVHNLSLQTQRGKKTGALAEIVSVLDSVSLLLVEKNLQETERRRLLHWNKTLGDLRCSLLGVEVKFTLSDTALSERQLTYLTLTKVTGLSKGGNTSVFFGNADPQSGWIIDEGFEHKLPLRLNDPYRLLSPKKMAYTFPPAYYQQQAEEPWHKLLFFVIHRAANREQDFTYRAEAKLTFGPRFSTEVLNPIVRMHANEHLRIRLTNFSRDGVADEVWVDDAYATAQPSRFRLSRKGATHLDVLPLTWRGDPPPGNYLMQVQIDSIPEANFVARKFYAAVDATKRIGLLSALSNSPVAEALRRLNLQYVALSPAGFAPRLDSLDVLVLDRRLLSFHPELAQQRAALQRFAEAGGHVIILAQEAPVWNKSPLWQGLHLLPVLQWEANTPLQTAASHALSVSPNRLTAEDWEGWLFQRAYNLLSGPALAEAEAPVKAMPESTPLVLTQTRGRGRFTYVDLALAPQLLNVHPGAFRFFANLIAL